MDVAYYLGRVRKNFVFIAVALVVVLGFAYFQGVPHIFLYAPFFLLAAFAASTMAPFCIQVIPILPSIAPRLFPHKSTFAGVLWCIFCGLILFIFWVAVFGILLRVAGPSIQPF